MSSGGDFLSEMSVEAKDERKTESMSIYERCKEFSSEVVDDR